MPETMESPERIELLKMLREVYRDADKNEDGKLDEVCNHS